MQNSKLLEELYLSVDSRRILVGSIHDTISPSARTLKVLDLILHLYSLGSVCLPLAGLCEESEAMAGHYMLEALSVEVITNGSHYTEDSIGFILQDIEKVLVKPRWSTLRCVSFKIQLIPGRNLCDSEALQSLPDKYLSQISKLESVAFNYSAYEVEFESVSG